MRFDDVIGHTDLKNQLKNMVDSGRISHALMFTGKEGSGKLALALAFGSYLLTKTSQDPAATQLKCDKFYPPRFLLQLSGKFYL